jgi:hypothetical protein
LLIQPRAQDAGVCFVVKCNFTLMNKIMLCLLLCVVFACKGKKKTEPKESFFPVSNFLKGEVSQAAASGQPIRKIETIDSLSDTTILNGESFKTLAAAFTSLPDINSDQWRDDYEEAKMYDEQLKNVILTYTARNKDAKVRREDVMLQPDEKGDTHVKTVIIDWIDNSKDSSVEKNMIWNAGEKFFIVTKVNKPQQPEKIKKVEVTWNNFPDKTSLQSTDK